MASEDVAQNLAHLELVSASTATHIASDSESEVGEDDEDEAEEAVLLGFVQGPVNPWSLSRQLFPHKAGGTPAWLDPINLPRGKATLCDFCATPLQFLLQIYAPIDGKEEAFHRMILVFMCPLMACLQQHHKSCFNSHDPKRSIRVFRCQLPRKNAFYSENPPCRNGKDLPSCNGARLCSWCGTWKGEKACGGCKQALYCSRAHQILHWKAGHASVCRSAQALEEKISIDNGLVTCACNTLWPEFEIVDEEEGPIDPESVNLDAPLASGNEVDQLRRDFEGLEPSEEQKHWAKFQERISRAHDQVLRYCRSATAKILWPRLDGQTEIAKVPACPLCKGARIFEFQILPQLLYYFGVSNQPDSLDWATIAVFSCSSSCSSAESYLEEVAWVQLAQ